MRFIRGDIEASVDGLLQSTDEHEKAVGFNFRVEENIGDKRRDQFETLDPSVDDIRELAQSYYDVTVQGSVRGHLPSTFDTALNKAALHPVSVEPNQKIVRLERIDKLIAREPTLDFERLSKALDDRNVDELDAFVTQFRQFPGERPMFSAFKSEVEEDLLEEDWLNRLIDRLGLYHHYPFEDGQTYSFALMEYTAKDVIDFAGANGLTACFAVATVFECLNNPAFFPVPLGSSNGFTVDLRERMPKRPQVREVLHVRMDYSYRYLSKFAQWGGAGLPDIADSRERHLIELQCQTGRHDFGDLID